MGERPAGPPTVTVTAVPEASEPLAPPPDSPVALVRRDCGATVALPDGGTLWLFCDTAQFGPDARLRWFVNTSAAVSSSETPLVVHDALDGSGPIPPLITPGPDVPACVGDQGRFTWPSAGVLVDDPAAAAGASADGATAVAVFYLNVCVTAAGSVAGATGVAALPVPDTAGVPPTGSTPALEPLEAERITDELFPRSRRGTGFGQAAVRVDDHVYTYRCPQAEEPCDVARAPARLDAVGDAGAWAVWTGDGWASDPEAAAPMEMPSARRGVKPSVAWLPDPGVFVWVDQRWNIPQLVQVRVAHRPEGPWSEPETVELPGCEGVVPEACYGLEVHGHLSTADELRLTWFDPGFAPGVAPPGRTATLGVRVDVASG